MKSAIIVLLSLASTTVFAAETLSPWGGCPQAIEFKADLIEEQIEIYLGKGDLDSAAEMASACANYGSSQDVAIISLAANALYKDLNKILNGRVQTQMEAMTARCTRRGQNEGGTLGMSVGAHCTLRVLRGFYAAYGK